MSLVGAGSASFGLETLYDIMSSEELHGGTIALIDIDEEKLKTMSRVAERLNEYFKANLKIESFMKTRDGLSGSDFVIIAVEKERMKRWWLDFQIPHKHGIKQVIGECGGPGGLAHTLRVVPLVLEICRDIEDLCPNALVMNYSNPEARVAYAINRYTKLRAVGLCPGIYGRMEWLSTALGRQVEALAAGLNHFTWILKLWFKESGENAYPTLIDRLKTTDDIKREPILTGEPLSRVLCLTYGYYPSPSDGHVGEYVPYAWNIVPERERGENWLSAVEKWSENIRKTVEDIATGRLSIERYRSPELIGGERGQAVNIIRAIVSNRRYFEYAVNIPNKGMVSNLPLDAVVEVPAVVDGSGIHPIHIGSLPTGIDALCYTQAVIQRLSVEAAYEGSYEKALQALLIDPVVHSVEAAKKTLDELLEAHISLLPQFKKAC
ncbi:alpha-glucosidase/alpha-galactosidase [Candidatus Bathyarchaeota archaeon]|nr:alpha-glucosidase/alpha-galactosidase [Candidatus Bathyarchaeota archaeon]MBS7617863.1 alpha-glucosidase/alpha-galactosidase [Candidatus Bathyarchaeota archaeon]